MLFIETLHQDKIFKILILIHLIMKNNLIMVFNKMKYLSILLLVPFIKNNYRNYREHSYRESSYV